MHTNQSTEWNRQLSERAADVFGKPFACEPKVDLILLRAEIDQLTLENNFLESAIAAGGGSGRKVMIGSRQSVQGY